MATAALKLEPEHDDQPESTDIAVVVQHNPVIVLIDDKKRDDLYAHIRREVEAFEPDISTAKGRDAIKSFAFKITRTKTAIDAAGKKLNEEARQQINVVDAARRDARATLDALSDQVRKPLDDWKAAEDLRITECREAILSLQYAATVSIDDTAETVRARGKRVWETKLDAEKFGDMLVEAQTAKTNAVETLKIALARLIKEEADRAELEKLRAEAAEREAMEIAEREERERIEAEKREAEEAERQRVEQERLAQERRVAAEKAEAERIAEAEKAAAERASREADERHQAELKAERDRAEKAERDAQAERDRIAELEAERLAEEKRLADERAEREADQAHRTAVKSAAKQAIMSCGADEDTARKIVAAILAGEIPNVSMEF